MAASLQKPRKHEVRNSLHITSRVLALVASFVLLAIAAVELRETETSVNLQAQSVSPQNDIKTWEQQQEHHQLMVGGASGPSNQPLELSSNEVLASGAQQGARYQIVFDEGKRKERVYVRTESADGFTCSFCNNREARLASSDKLDAMGLQRYRKRGMDFADPSDSGRRPFIFCPVAKNGSTSWKRLLLKLGGELKYNTIPQGSVHAPGRYNGLVNLSPDGAAQLLLDKDIPMVFLSRNPYVRLLSGYLEKSKKGSISLYRDTNGTIRRDIKKHGSQKTFSGFVKKMYRLKQLLDKRGLSFSKFNKQGTREQVNHHFALQSSFCGIPAGVRYDYLLKIERMNEWYDGLVDELGLREDVSHGWPTPGSCFLSTAKNNCTKGSVALVDEWGGITYSSVGSGAHNTAADQRLLEYYTPEVLRMVNEVYMPDFQMFGYQVWDGTGAPVLN